LDRAIADASEAILLHAPCIEAYAVRSEAYRKKYEIDRAIADATEAIRLAPNSPLGFFHRAAAYRIDFIRNKQ